MFSTAVSLGLTYVAGRAAWRGGKRLIGWVRNQRLLPGSAQNPSQEAQDVVVEPAGWESDRGTPRRPEGAEGPRVRKTQQRPSYTRLNIDDTLTADQVIRVLRRLQGNQVLGTRAVAVIDTLNSADMRLESLLTELDATFQRGSISWEKFATPSYGAYDAILRNVQRPVSVKIPHAFSCQNGSGLASLSSSFKSSKVHIKPRVTIQDKDIIVRA